MTAALLITGVGKRAGLHLARSFLQRGMPIIGTYRTERPGVRELREAGAELIRCDFYRKDDVESLIDTVRSGHGRLRAIIHNASDWLPDQGELPPDDVMRRMMQVHAGAPYRINLALAPLLQAAGEETPADIIHIGDYVSGRGSRKHIAYAASKAAQDNLTLSFAALLAPRVKVNSIAPALLMFNEDDPADYRERALPKNLLAREGGLDELQRTVDYLLESRFVTGRLLHLDGGRHLNQL